MQRKRRNINFGNFSKSPGKYQKKFNNSITKLTLHSIPTVRMSEKSNKKSLVALFETFCGKVVNSANVTWWRSPDRIPFGAVIRTRASHTFMVPFGGIERSLEFVNTRSSLEMTPFGEMQRYPEYSQSHTGHIVMTPLSRSARYLSFSRNLKFSLYIICTLLLSFVASNIMSGLNGECYAAVNPTASLSVSNPTLSTTVAPGDTAYLSSNVTYSASDIDSYTLQVSYANGYSSLKLDGGSATLAGAGGKVGSSLANNSWGFAWTNNTTNNTNTNSGLTYYTVPTYGTNGSGLSTGRLESATLPASANNTLSSTTKRIVFAAKFAENNTNSGHYKTGVQLSMVATPRKMTLADISTMQDMYGNYSICTNSSTGIDYGPIKDARDNNSYKVRKFADGRCWMVENLRITGRTIKATESDFSGSDITLPSSAKSDFTDANKFTYRSILLSEANSGSTGYYNWYTATAGAGTSSVTSGTVNTSICPKGWKLPSGNSGGEYEKFANAESIPNSTAGSNKIQATPYNFKYTGRVYDGSLYGTSFGFWWSSTAYAANNAYRLYIDRSGVYPGTNGDNRYYGFAVRCIARE